MSRRTQLLTPLAFLLCSSFALAQVSWQARQAKWQANAAILGTAQSFAVLAGSAVINTGATVVFGDLGVSPGSAVTGFPPGIVNGTIHAADAVALQAQSDLTIAYVALAGMAPDQDLSGMDLGGLTLTAGVYFFSTSAQLTGTLTLNAEGDPDAMFVFQIGSALTTASNSSVATIKGADDCHVFWQIGSSATLGAGTSFKGNILALTSITLNTNATILDGRALARNGAVTLDDNDIVAGCTCVLGNKSKDCNSNGVPDECDIDDGTSLDCNSNGVPDECDIAGGTSPDCDGNGVPDECQPDSDGDGTIDACEIPAECWLFGGRGAGTALVTVDGIQFRTQIQVVNQTWEVTMEDFPAFPLPTRRPASIGLWGIDRPLVMSVQVVMYNPEVFPLNPHQWTQRMDVYVAPNELPIVTWHGTMNGMHLNYAVFVGPDGRWYVHFPFTIVGM